MKEQNQIISRGAEAIIYKEKSNIIKHRIAKSYRYPELDEKLRKLRTRQEAKILEKIHNSKITNVPKVILVDEINKTIELENIKGKKLADYLEKLNLKKICEQLGNSIARVHSAGIIHGDLTTSNMILSSKNNKVYLIDFGLGFHSSRVEDKAVDLHVLKEALQARHPSIYEKAFALIIKSYKKHSPQATQILNQLARVEKRGRYKAQY